MGKRYLKLYWVETDDHDEDWFIVAKSIRQAASLHEKMEGYDPGDAYAELVMPIPEDLVLEEPIEPGWPSRELLIALGAIFLADEPTRVVEIDGRRYCEGMLAALIDEVVDDQFEKIGRGRPNNSTRTHLND